MILDRAVGSFVPDGRHRFRILGDFEAAHVTDGLPSDVVRAAGIFGDVTTLRALRKAAKKRRRHECAQAGEAEATDPFAVTVKIVDRANTIEELVEWNEEDRQQCEAAFRAARRERLTAGLSPGDRFLALRDPFQVTLRA